LNNVPEQEKTSYYQLNPGYEFSPHSFTLDASRVSAYLAATRDSEAMFQKEGLVPPMAVAAFAMIAQAQGVTFPSGTVHVTQELDFLIPVRVGDTITCHSKVSRKNFRGGLYIMATELTVLNQKQEKVLTGKVGFVLPSPGKDA
jgi:acyl dehydratase